MGRVCCEWVLVSGDDHTFVIASPLLTKLTAIGRPKDTWKLLNSCTRYVRVRVRACVMTDLRKEDLNYYNYDTNSVSGCI